MNTYTIDRWKREKELMIARLIHWVIPDPPPPWLELAIAEAVKLTGMVIEEKAIASKLRELSKTMATSATSEILNKWEDDPKDPIDPIEKLPWPPHPRKDTEKPNPNPWKAINSADQIDAAYFLTQLSGLTSSPEYNAALKRIAVEVVKSVSMRLDDDFIHCGTLPRPLPKR